MPTTHNDLVARAKEITAREKVVYSERTKRSQIATERARKVMPAGVPSSFQAYEPWPVVVKHAAGSRMITVAASARRALNTHLAHAVRA